MIARTALTTVAVVALFAPTVAADHVSTTRESVSSDGAQANDGSSWPSISVDGRYVVFSSNATNLVAGDTNNEEDVFVRDRQTGAVERVSMSTDGMQGDGGSTEPAVTPDGRYVVFTSLATNLVPGDSNHLENGLGRDVFLRDRVSGTTERISVSTEGTEGEGFGNYVPSISTDGRYVAWVGWMAGLDPDDTHQCTPFQIPGECPDVFVRDRVAGTTTLVSLSPSGEQAQRGVEPDATAISADGRYVAFVSLSANLVPGDTNNATDIFVRDRETGTTERVSKSSQGEEALASSTAPSMSADGRYVAFTSEAPNLVADDVELCFYWFDSFETPCPDVFVHDRETGDTTHASVSSDGEPGDDWSEDAAISADGRHVAFVSKATNLVADDVNRVPDVFVRDLDVGTTTRVSIADAGVQGVAGAAFFTGISADGRYVAFVSGASNLVAGDTNFEEDVFVRDRGPVACPTGARAEGPVSSVAYDAEPGGPADPVIRSANCEVLVPAGL